MYTDELMAIQRDWAGQSLALMRELLPLMAPVSKRENWDEDQISTIVDLLCATARSTESTLLLCAYGQLWDAEMTVRAVFEGSLKFAYLLQSRELFEKRHHEYSKDLFDSHLLKDHQKATTLLEALKNPDAALWRPVYDRVLDPKEHAELSARLLPHYRKSLDSKWGFTSIIGELSRSGDSRFTGFVGLAHTYSMASHVLHADSIGTSISMERDRREPIRRDAAHLAHLGRLLSDTFSCLLLRLFAGYSFVEEDLAPIYAAKDKVDALGQATWEPSIAEWLEIEYGARDERQE